MGFSYNHPDKPLYPDKGMSRTFAPTEKEKSIGVGNMRYGYKSYVTFLYALFLNGGA